MPPKIIDPLAALAEDREARSEPSAAQVTGLAPSLLAAPAILPGGHLSPAYRDRVKEDFRLFLTLLWRRLLGNDPNPIQLDMAGFLQHGPERSVIMAFRGFSKSWITGAYGLWRLDRDPNENVLVVSGSAARAIASTNWMLQLIYNWDLLNHLKPKPSQRSSSQTFDVGPAGESQSASVFSLGIGGQLVGFRASCIIPDDVETQTNSITAQMREKVSEAVKEFDSVIKPGGVIKYLGTPHDTESLYDDLIGKRGYTGRVWCAEYPDDELRKALGDRLAPYILRQLAKLGPDAVGHSTMPMRFPDDDLAKRKLSLGNSEYRLQFLLDTSQADKNKFPLKLHDLMVMPLDLRQGPERVAWSDDASKRLTELPSMGRGNDYYFPAVVPGEAAYRAYNRRVGGLDISGGGSDEAAISVVGELNANLFLLHNQGWLGVGFDIEVLRQIADLCVRLELHQILIEENFGDGMFIALFTPVLAAAWRKENAARHKRGQEPGGTEIVPVKASNKMNKERRLLALLEPIVQSHRLVVAKKVIEDDFASLKEIEGEDTRHAYSLFHQYAHLTRDKDCLRHDDRLDSLGIAVSAFADIIGADPELMASEAGVDRLEEELRKIYGETDDDEYGLPTTSSRPSERATSFKPTQR